MIFGDLCIHGDRHVRDGIRVGAVGGPAPEETFRPGSAFIISNSGNMVNTIAGYLPSAGIGISWGISTGKDSELIYKKQEDILKRFRQKDLNLLVSTSVLEEGIDLPKCNLVVKFDLPHEYRSYVQSKGRARATKSKYYMLVQEAQMEKFMAELKTYKGIENVSYENEKLDT